LGWASCTVNDVTGELLITSDWGNWSHRWDPRPSCLGAPSLTVFIATRGDVDYLARKLQLDDGSGQRWSSAATAAALRRELCRQRLKEGRDQLQHWLESDNGEKELPLFSNRYVDAPTWNDPHRKERFPYLTRGTARQLWSAIGGIANEIRGSADLFYERVLQIDSFEDYVTEEPWQYHETEQALGDLLLRESVLPALITACRDRANRPSASKSHP
jgi:hypothetical protein